MFGDVVVDDDDEAESIDADGATIMDVGFEAAGGCGVDVDCCSSTNLARFNTLAMCSCSSRFKWLRSSSTGEGIGGMEKAEFLDERGLGTLSIEIGRERRVIAVPVTAADDDDADEFDKRPL